MVAQCKSSKRIKTILAAAFATCLRNLNWNNVIHQNNNNNNNNIFKPTMMRVSTIQKAGSFVSKAIPTANKAAAANNGCYYFSTEGGDQRKELEYPRAVSKEEAPFVKPPKETGTEALLPWRGWVERLLRDKMNPKTFDNV